MTVDEIIDRAGGVTRMAARFGVSHSTICDWRRNGQIPVGRARAVSEELDIPLSEIRPDFWSPSEAA